MRPAAPPPPFLNTATRAAARRVRAARRTARHRPLPARMRGPRSPFPGRHCACDHPPIRPRPPPTEPARVSPPPTITVSSTEPARPQPLPPTPRAPPRFLTIANRSAVSRRGRLKQRASRTHRTRTTTPTFPDPPRFKLRPLPPSPGPLYPHRAAASGNPGLAASQWPRAGRPLCPSDNQWRAGAGPGARRGGRDRPRLHGRRQGGGDGGGRLYRVTCGVGLPSARRRRPALGLGLRGATGGRDPAQSHCTHFRGALYRPVPLRASPVAPEPPHCRRSFLSTMELIGFVCKAPQEQPGGGNVRVWDEELLRCVSEDTRLLRGVE